MLYYAGGFSVAGRRYEETASTSPLLSSIPPRFDLPETNIQAAKREFINIVGDSGLDENLAARIARSSTDWSPAPHGELDRPCLIVYPRSTAEVSQIVKVCHNRRIPIIGFGGGTSLEGTLAAIHGEV